MKETTENIKNLTSLWQIISEPSNSYFKETDVEYSIVKNSEWPNRLWFNNDIDKSTVKKTKAKLTSIATKLVVPYWDIYNSNSYQLLEENGFKLKFEQIAMFLKPEQLFTELNTLNFKKVSNKEDAELWSLSFSKSFGYYINPSLLEPQTNNTTFYIAFHQNTAVGTAILHTTNGVSGIHAVGVLPEERRKGYAEQIMKFLINESIKINSKLITLQASKMGKDLYTKLGFTEQFIIKNYIL